jgi:hypothetical protein
MGRILMVGLFVSTLVFAQRGGGGGRSRNDDSMQGMRFNSVTPLDRVSEMLKLTKDQKKDFKAAMDEGQKEATPVQEQIVKSRQSIADAVAGGKNTEELVKAEGVLEAQMTEIELRTFAKVTESLEADQKQHAGGLFAMMHGIFSRKNWNSTEN